MLMLKMPWDEISQKINPNCFRQTGISTQSQKSAMDENNNPFKVLCNDDPIGEIEFDLNQLCAVKQELAAVNRNVNELFDNDADNATTNLQPLTVEEIVRDLNDEPHAESDNTNDGNIENATSITPPTWDELD